MSRLRKFKTPKISTVIGHGTKIKGDLSFSGGLHLDGVIEGCLTTNQDDSAMLTVSEQGSIEGDVRVPNVILNGAVVGDVYANGRVELEAKARVTGTVYYNLLEMAMGAEVNGQLKHVNENEPRMLPSKLPSRSPSSAASGVVASTTAVSKLSLLNVPVVVSSIVAQLPAAQSVVFGSSVNSLHFTTMSSMDRL